MWLTSREDFTKSCQLTDATYPTQKVDPRILQINLTGFLEKNTSLFVKVWHVLENSCMLIGSSASVLDKAQELSQNFCKRFRRWLLKICIIKVSMPSPGLDCICQTSININICLVPYPSCISFGTWQSCTNLASNQDLTWIQNTKLRLVQELWVLLASATGTASGIPQKLLDDKEAEIKAKKKMEDEINVRLVPVGSPRSPHPKCSALKVLDPPNNLCFAVVLLSI